MFTLFYDMHSGGECQEPPFEQIYIEAEEDEARTIFYHRFGHSPEDVCCSCCGENYWLFEGETLEELSARDRGCRAIRGDVYDLRTARVSVETFEKRPDILVIRACQIQPFERITHSGMEIRRESSVVCA